MKRLIVLDDELAIGRIIGDIAEESGFEVILTTSPAEFNRQFVSKPPDLIVLDLIFPGGDGIEMLRRLEASHYKGALILVSGMDDRVLTTARRLGVELGLDVIGSVKKPFKAAAIRDLFARIANLHPDFSANDIRTGIAQSELTPHYQPVVDMKSKQVLGVEALVRWIRPGRGTVMPDEFLPTVVQEGLMSELTRSVMATALTDVVSWRWDGVDLRVAINAPASIVLDPAFFDQIAAARRDLDTDPPRMTIELTEAEATDEPVRMMEVLSRLRLIGVELAIDDFGTGFSSLVQLRRLPFNHLKIDKSFVLSCTTEADGAAITRAVIDLSHALGIRVVAEGVETREIWDRLTEWGCDAAQGYFVGRAMPRSDVAAWVHKWPTVAPT